MFAPLYNFGSDELFQGHSMDTFHDKPGAVRSPHWCSVRAAHLKLHPVCEACGGTDHLEVHHEAPYHVHPERELSEDNLVTLCEAPGKDCHYALGHAYNWHGWNPDVRADAIIFRKRVERSRVLAGRKP